MQASSKLYTLTEETFRLFSFADRNDKVHTVPAENIPMIRWPDGRWCLPANLFMLKLFEQGRSRKYRGGTLHTYSTQISLLIRYCFNNNVDLFQVSNSRFTQFIRSLEVERPVVRGGKLRKIQANSVITTGRVCLNFLAFVGKFYDVENYVGERGRIRAERRTHIVPSKRHDRPARQVSYWYHHSFPEPGDIHKRLPINDSVVERLRGAAVSHSSSMYLRRRRQVMLTLLEIVGPRRAEVAKLTVKSVRDADAMQFPKLSLITDKNGGNSTESRLVPVSRADLSFILEFIKINRNPLVKRTCGVKEDDGFVLVSATTGKGLQPNTITTEVYLLARASGIEERAHPHLYRHRFVTKLFIALIEQHQFENVDDFRKAMLDSETFKREVQQYTGHKNIESLEIYLHLAFAHFTNFKKTIDQVNLSRLVDSVEHRIEMIELDRAAGVAPKEIVAQLEILLASVKTDLKQFTQGPDSSK